MRCLINKLVNVPITSLAICLCRARGIPTVRARVPSRMSVAKPCTIAQQATEIVSLTADRLTISVACWAMVHGLATLILEGTLARTVGIPRARQRQVANEVIATFTSLFINDRT